MAFTSTDLTNLETARMQLLTGARKVAVRLQDGSTVQYGIVNAADLDNAIAQARIDVAQSSTTPRARFIRASFTKGL